MQKIIQIYPCLLKLSRKQESVTDGQTDRWTDTQTDGQTAAITISPHHYRGGIKSSITGAMCGSGISNLSSTPDF